VAARASKLTFRLISNRQRLPELLPLAYRLGVPVLAGTDTAGLRPRTPARPALRRSPPPRPDHSSRISSNDLSEMTVESQDKQ
jgi:hypothetical protein